jgi:hypothetical protein
MRSMLQGIVLLLLIGSATAVAGCARVKEIKLPETGADLKGTVTYNGEKVMVAMVIVQSAGGSAAGHIEDDGTFNIKNVPVGEVNIGINTEAGKGELKGKMMARAQTKQTLPMPKIIDLPSKYFDPTTSGIHTTVNKGSNTYDVVIKK